MFFYLTSTVYINIPCNPDTRTESPDREIHTVFINIKLISLWYRSGIIIWIIDVNIRQYLTAGDDVNLLGHSLQVI